LPIVIVNLANAHVIDEEAKSAIKLTIKTFGSQTFRLEDRKPLSAKDFSVIFKQVSKDSEIAYDILICVHLHASAERIIEGLPDQHAEQLALALNKAIDQLIVEKNLTIGVALLHSIMGWSTTTVRPNGRVSAWPGDR
jgi:hypothetical protein